MLSLVYAERGVGKVSVASMCNVTDALCNWFCFSIQYLDTTLISLLKEPNIKYKFLSSLNNVISPDDKSTGKKKGKWLLLKVWHPHLEAIIRWNMGRDCKCEQVNFVKGCVHFRYLFCYSEIRKKREKREKKHTTMLSTLLLIK